MPGDIAGVMHTRMLQGKSVHIKGLGYFRYVLDTKGVKDPADFNFEKQVQAVRVQFVPERTRMAVAAMMATLEKIPSDNPLRIKKRHWRWRSAVLFLFKGHPGTSIQRVFRPINT